MTKIESYKQAIDFLYDATPQFQRIGAAAYKPGLESTMLLDNLFGNPHRKFRSIHIGGTNGKGSTAHTIAAVLQSAGMKVGLYTSPHLVDFRERIRVNGEKISEEGVIGFLNRFIDMKVATPLSFFELTTIMAFDYFAESKVDVAVIEVGLGGRLDCTNIITPDISVITNISRDHVAQLGYELTSIAEEKAGIFKEGIPAVVGEAEGEVRDVFVSRAKELSAPLRFAEPLVTDGIYDDRIIYPLTPFGRIEGELTGDCQPKNAATICAALQTLVENGWNIPAEAVRKGFANVVELTSLAGRWMKLGRNPLIVADTGHNEGGWKYLASHLESYGDRLHVVIGFVNDKDVTTILGMLPRQARYYFTNAAIPRALNAQELCAKGIAAGLSGEAYPSVGAALDAARKGTSPDDVIFVGGSTFIVADLLRLKEFGGEEE